MAAGELIKFPWKSEHVEFSNPIFGLPGGIDLVIQKYHGSPTLEELKETVRSIAQINREKTPGCRLISVVDIGGPGNYQPELGFLKTLIAGLTTEVGGTNGVQGIIYGAGVSRFLLFFTSTAATKLGGTVRSATNLAQLNKLLHETYRAEFSLNENLEVVTST